ncbi:peptidase M36, partial [Chytridium lagenaria]
NVQAAIVNAFYVANMFHDIMHFYGFNEASGNFQRVNYGSAGRGGDQVNVMVQDRRSKNLAYFITDKDGIPGTLVLHAYDLTRPGRDPALDNTILIRTLTHGLANRLTGGPNALCLLTTPEGQGLAEGYADIIALLLTSKSTHTRTTSRPIGSYLTNTARGLRSHFYTTVLSTNPLLYDRTKTLLNSNDVVGVGTVWASLLWEVYWNLVDVNGFSNRYILDARTTRGNIRFLQLLVASMKLLPCSPSLIDGRDALLTADWYGYDSLYFCAIWRGFARRGLGYTAKPFDNAFNLPPEC